MFSSSDTIVAIATPPGRGALGVLRVSGPNALAVCQSLLSLSAPLRPRHASLTRFRDASGCPVDEVLATFFPGPHSYTAEDVVEVSFHGGPALLRAGLEAVVQAGARLAGPGEFTLRAYLNGRLDLLQAEAVGDLVAASTRLQAGVAFDQLDGSLTAAVTEIDAALFDVCARLEASLDFPEEGYHFAPQDDVLRDLAGIRDGLARLLRGAGAGRLLREGRRVAIVGPPNVGKSTLFNWLVGTERAIVSEWPGTTRDLVTERVDFDGVCLDLVDTAGIRDGEDPIEREGVVRARRAAETAEAVLAVFDVSVSRAPDTRAVLGAVAHLPHVVVLNKCDCGEHRDWAGEVVVSGVDAVRVSLRTGMGLDGLRGSIWRLLGVDGGVPRDIPLVTTVRQESLVRRAFVGVDRALAACADDEGRPSEEFLLADLSEARVALEEIRGRRVVDDVLAHVFSRFCVGK